MQFVAAAAPRVVEVLPAAHVKHVFLDTAPTFAEYVPGAQLVHPACPGFSEYFPALHGVHVEEAATDDSPAAQGLQTSGCVAALSVLYWPGKQAADCCNERNPVSFLYLPGGNAKHLPWAEVVVLPIVSVWYPARHVQCATPGPEVNWTMQADATVVGAQLTYPAL